VILDGIGQGERPVEVDAGQDAAKRWRLQPVRLARACLHDARAGAQNPCSTGSLEL